METHTAISGQFQLSRLHLGPCTKLVPAAFPEVRACFEVQKLRFLFILKKVRATQSTFILTDSHFLTKNLGMQIHQQICILIFCWRSLMHLNGFRLSFRESDDEASSQTVYVFESTWPCESQLALCRSAFCFYSQAPAFPCLCHLKELVTVRQGKWCKASHLWCSHDHAQLFKRQHFRKSVWGVARSL